MGDHSKFASDEIERLLIANGLHDLESAFAVGEPVTGEHAERAVRHEFKRVVNLELNTPDGPMSVYIKRQWRRERLLPRPTEILHGIGLKCTPIHEWRGLQIMQDSGLNVAEPLALFWRGWGFSSGAIVTRALTVSQSLADLIQSGELERMDLERRNALIEAAINVVAQLRRARVAWRSMKAKHFYPEETARGKWRIWLIDCEGVSSRAFGRDHKRQWSFFLHYLTLRAPELREAFLTQYTKRLSA